MWLSVVAGLYIAGDWSWRTPSILQVIGPAYVFVVALFMPESPRVSTPRAM